MLLQNFGAVEQTIEQDKHLDFSVSDRDVSVNASVSVSHSRHSDHRGTVPVPVITEQELNHMASLERVAHTTLHLTQQLQSSSEQITAALSSTNTNTNTNTNTTSDPKEMNVNTNTPLLGDTERAQFTMKLAPRIRALEKNSTHVIGTHLERVLRRRMHLYQTKHNDRHGTFSDHDNDNDNDEMISSSSSSSSSNSNSNELLILGHLFRSFTLLNKASDAESTFARVAIMPLVRNKVSIGKLDEGGSRGECTGLKALLEDVKVEIYSAWGDVLRSMEGNFDMYVIGDEHETPVAPPPQVDLITAGVWVPILTALLTDPAIRMAIFSPGIASIFQQNYSVLDHFVSNLAVNLLDPPSAKTNTSTATEVPSDSSNSITASPSKQLSRNDDIDEDQMALTALYYRPQIDSRILQSAQSRIYSHPMTSEYSKKWNLPIYYQLRFGQICSRIEEAIHKIQYSNEGWHRQDNVMTFSNESESGNGNEVEGYGYGFELAFFRELVDALSWLWREDVFLKPLTHRFLRGTMQILGRIISFIKDGLEGGVKFGLMEQGQDNEGQSLEGQGENERNVSAGASRTNANVNANVNANTNASPYEYTWNDRIEDVAAVSWELTVLEKYIVQHHVPTIVETICSTQSQSPRQQEQEDHSSSDETVTLVKEIMSEASKEITPVVHKIWDEIIVNIMISQCSAPLLAVKGIAATYRMTNRPPPTQPSPFVNAILRPLHDFDTSVSSRTPPYLGISWKKRIVDDVSERYNTAVSELIETVQRTEEALKNRKARRALAGGMSDGEKVRLQLYLDQKAFVLAVEGVGLDPQTVEGVGKLIDLTKDSAHHHSSQAAASI